MLASSKTKLLISITLLIVLFAFLYFFTGVFGSTQIALTLTTNPDLERGLVGHWTFDGPDVSGATVTDRSGQGNTGNLMATSTPGSEVAIDLDAEVSDDQWDNAAPNLVWISDTEGFIFYTQQSNIIAMASTSDSGVTWGNLQTVDSVNTTDAIKAAVWYDRWTPGDNTGVKIHIVTMDDEVNGTYYTEYDTVTNVLSTTVLTGAEVPTMGNKNTNGITKAADGTLYVGAVDNDDSWVHVCSSSCTSAVNWSAITDPWGASDGVDYMQMLPVMGTNNIMLINWDTGADDIESNIYSATSTSWWGWDTGITQTQAVNDIYAASSMGATVNRKTGEIYLVAVDDANDFITSDHDLYVWEFDNETFAWTQKTSIFENLGNGDGLGPASISIDENTGDLYVIYGRLSTIGTPDSIDMYYVVSKDNGDTWSSESAQISSSNVDLLGGMVNAMSSERIGVFYQYNVAADLYYVDVADIGAYAKPKPGKIGQALDFDGMDDYVIDTSVSALSGSFTFAVWVKGDSDPVTAVRTYIGEYRDRNFFLKWDSNSGPTESFGYTTCLGSNNYAVYGSVSGGRWYHIIGTWDGTTLRAYRDGILIDSNITGNTPCTSEDNDFYIGDGLNGDIPFNGTLDDVRIYNRALSAAEITRLYGLGATTKIATTITTNPDLERGLVGHWTFDGPYINSDDTTTEIKDRITTTFQGNFVGAALSEAIIPGKIGQALQFDGSDDCVDFDGGAQPTYIPIFTASLWVFSTSVPLTSQSEPSFLLKHRDRNIRIKWHDNGTDEGEVSYRDAATTIRADFTGLTANNWHHLVGTFDGVNLIAYTDGELSNSTACSGSCTPDNELGEMGIGCNGATPLGHFFDGVIDDVRLYDRALSPEEITRLYGLGATTKVATTITTNPDLERGLVGHWTFDGPDLINNAVDRSGSGNTGYLTNFTSTTTKRGRMGQALDFDGNDDYIEILNDSSLNFGATDAFTITAWVKYFGSDADQTIYRQATGANPLLTVERKPTGVVRFQLQNAGGITLDSTSSLNDGTWHHVVARRESGGDAELFVDGVSESTGSFTQTLVNSQNYRIGARQDDTEFFNGLIDDVRIYDRALSAAEILRLYQLGK